MCRNSHFACSQLTFVKKMNLSGRSRTGVGRSASDSRFSPSAAFSVALEMDREPLFGLTRYTAGRLCNLTFLLII